MGSATDHSHAQAAFPAESQDYVNTSSQGESSPRPPLVHTQLNRVICGWRDRYEDPLKQTEEIKSRLDRNIEISEDVRERLSRLEGLFVQQQQQQQQRQRQQQAPSSHFIPLQFPPEQPVCIPGPSRHQQPYERSDLRRASIREEDVEAPPGLKGRITEGSFFGTSAMATVEQPGLLDHGDQVRRMWLSTRLLVWPW